MRRGFVRGLALVVGLTLAGHAMGVNLSVAPLRIVLTPERPVASLTMGNAEDAEVAVQAEVLTWTQRDGQDAYEPTREVLINPPIFRLPAGGRQIVRLGLQTQTQTQARERSYRVFLCQLPRDQVLPRDGAPGPQLQTLLRIGVPIFVPSLQPQSELRWSLQPAGHGADGRYRLVLDNLGNAHVQILQLVVRGEDGTELRRKAVSHYVLAGQSAAIDAELPQLPPDSRLLIEARTDASEAPSTAIVRVPRAPAAPH